MLPDDDGYSENVCTLNFAIDLVFYELKLQSPIFINALLIRVWFLSS